MTRRRWARAMPAAKEEKEEKEARSSILSSASLRISFTMQSRTSRWGGPYTADNFF